MFTLERAKGTPGKIGRTKAREKEIGRVSKNIAQWFLVLQVHSPSVEGIQLPSSPGCI